MRRVAPKFTVAAAVLVGAMAAQEPVFRGGIELVDLLVTVRDWKGVLRKDLSQSDFRILEDGRQQEIRRFARITDLPLTIGMVVDVSGSVKDEIADERRAAGQFFTQVLREQDQAFLIGFAQAAFLLQDLTNSVQKLQAGIDELLLQPQAEVRSGTVMAQFPGRLPFPIPTIPVPGPGQPPGKWPPVPGGPPIGRGSMLPGTVLFDAVFLAADEVLKPTLGRKAIILITDGEDNGSKTRLAEALEAAVRADVIIYSIFVRGDRQAGGGEEVLQRLSGETGGRVYRLQRNLEKIFAEINEELRSQYSISYVPTNSVPNGSFRRIEVRMANRDYKAQTRPGYYAKEQR